eukprot:TRINITY_DN15585_c0_g1_i1.p1 TRINITY_DN15585_c0_g1~~TRINITY_DN15585_c0_g1_i1.p1  ORF type:complete len:1608 (-),score=602.93 TRINITY_DN15585_c0_g1_i1:128-4951(-)
MSQGQGAAASPGRLLGGDVAAPSLLPTSGRGGVASPERPLFRAVVVADVDALTSPLRARGASQPSGEDTRLGRGGEERAEMSPKATAAVQSLPFAAADTLDPRAPGPAEPLSGSETLAEEEKTQTSPAPAPAAAGAAAQLAADDLQHQAAGVGAEQPAQASLVKHTDEIGEFMQTAAAHVMELETRLEAQRITADVAIHNARADADQQLQIADAKLQELSRQLQAQRAAALEEADRWAAEKYEVEVGLLEEVQAKENNVVQMKAEHAKMLTESEQRHEMVVGHWQQRATRLERQLRDWAETASRLDEALAEQRSAVAHAIDDDPASRRQLQLSQKRAKELQDKIALPLQVAVADAADCAGTVAELAILREQAQQHALASEKAAAASHLALSRLEEVSEKERQLVVEQAKTAEAAQEFLSQSAPAPSLGSERLEIQAQAAAKIRLVVEALEAVQAEHREQRLAAEEREQEKRATEELHVQLVQKTRCLEAALEKKRADSRQQQRALDEQNGEVLAALRAAMVADAKQTTLLTRPLLEQSFKAAGPGQRGQPEAGAAAAASARLSTLVQVEDAAQELESLRYCSAKQQELIQQYRQQQASASDDATASAVRLAELQAQLARAHQRLDQQALGQLCDSCAATPRQGALEAVQYIEHYESVISQLHSELREQQKRQLQERQAEELAEVEAATAERTAILVATLAAQQRNADEALVKAVEEVRSSAKEKLHAAESRNHELGELLLSQREKADAELRAAFARVTSLEALQESQRGALEKAITDVSLERSQGDARLRSTLEELQQLRSSLEDEKRRNTALEDRLAETEAQAKDETTMARVGQKQLAANKLKLEELQGNFQQEAAEERQAADAKLQELARTHALQMAMCTRGAQEMESTLAQQNQALKGEVQAAGAASAAVEARIQDARAAVLGELATAREEQGCLAAVCTQLRRQEIEAQQQAKLQAERLGRELEERSEERAQLQRSADASSASLAAQKSQQAAELERSQAQILELVARLTDASSRSEAEAKIAAAEGAALERCRQSELASEALQRRELDSLRKDFEAKWAVSQEELARRVSLDEEKTRALQREIGQRKERAAEESRGAALRIVELESQLQQLHVAVADSLTMAGEAERLEAELKQERKDAVAQAKRSQLHLATLEDRLACMQATGTFAAEGCSKSSSFRGGGQTSAACVERLQAEVAAARAAAAEEGERRRADREASGRHLASMFDRGRQKEASIQSRADQYLGELREQEKENRRLRLELQQAAAAAGEGGGAGGASSSTACFGGRASSPYKHAGTGSPSDVDDYLLKKVGALEEKLEAQRSAALYAEARLAHLETQAARAEAEAACLPQGASGRASQLKSQLNKQLATMDRMLGGSEELREMWAEERRAQSAEKARLVDMQQLQLPAAARPSAPPLQDIAVDDPMVMEASFGSSAATESMRRHMTHSLQPGAAGSAADFLLAETPQMTRASRRPAGPAGSSPALPACRRGPEPSFNAGAAQLFEERTTMLPPGASGWLLDPAEAMPSPASGGRSQRPPYSDPHQQRFARGAPQQLPKRCSSQPLLPPSSPSQRLSGGGGSLPDTGTDVRFFRVLGAASPRPR